MQRSSGPVFAVEKCVVGDFRPNAGTAATECVHERIGKFKNGRPQKPDDCSSGFPVDGNLQRSGHDPSATKAGQTEEPGSDFRSTAQSNNKINGDRGQ